MSTLRDLFKQERERRVMEASQNLPQTLEEAHQEIVKLRMGLRGAIIEARGALLEIKLILMVSGTGGFTDQELIADALVEIEDLQEFLRKRAEKAEWRQAMPITV